MVRGAIKAPLLRPDLVVSALEVEGALVGPLLSDLRTQLPDALRAIITGRYTTEELLALAPLHLASNFLWDNLEHPAFPAAHKRL